MLTVDIDVNKVAFGYLDTGIGPVGSIIGLAKNISSLGIDEMFVGDPIILWYGTNQAIIEYL